MNTITTDIISCPRCGDDHYRLEFTPFTVRPIRVCSNSDSTFVFVYTHFCLCPTNKEPILLKLSNQGC